MNLKELAFLWKATTLQLLLKKRILKDGILISNRNHYVANLGKVA